MYERVRHTCSLDPVLCIETDYARHVIECSTHARVFRCVAQERDLWVVRVLHVPAAILRRCPDHADITVLQGSNIATVQNDATKMASLLWRTSMWFSYLGDNGVLSF